MWRPTKLPLGRRHGPEEGAPFTAGGLRASATQWNGTSRSNGPCEPSAMDPSVGSGSSNAVTARPAGLRARKYRESGLRPNPVGGIRPDGGH